MHTVSTQSASETEAVGAGLASELAVGDVVAVSGELGSGKTTLIRGALRALGVSGAVRSPTFMIGSLYQGAVPVAHLDLYRLESVELEDLALLSEYLDRRRISFVEWPERTAGSLPRVNCRIAIEHAGSDRRNITIE